jgi:hypothetical protein
VTDTTVRDHIVGLVVSYVASGLNSDPLADLYDVTSGYSLGYKARALVGGHLALLTV